MNRSRWSQPSAEGPGREGALLAKAGLINSPSLPRMGSGWGVEWGGNEAVLVYKGSRGEGSNSLLQPWEVWIQLSGLDLGCA